MNNKDLLKAIGDIDDRYLNEISNMEEQNQIQSENKVNIIKKLKLKYILAPVCVIIIVLIGISKSNLFNLKSNENNKEKQWTVKEIYVEEELASAEIPRWEERSITEKFNSVEYNKGVYLSKKTKIANDRIENNIGTSTFTGHDSYTNSDYNKIGNLYKIKDLSEKCVIAVQFENDKDYYVYTNILYKPETLKEFMEDLKLKEIVSFGKIRYNYWNPDSEEKIKYETIEFNDEDDKIIWEMLFSNLYLENIYTDNGKYRSDKFSTNIEISVDIELLGYKNISVELTDKGYLITNILDSGKAFYIGEEKVKEFLDYIMKNYDGYKIVYIYKNDNETKNEDKKDNENLQIVTHNMIDNTDTYINQTPNTMIDMSIENRTQQNISNSI